VVGGGPRPADVIDRLRDVNWLGVYGNTDEMLWRRERVSETLQTPALAPVRDGLLAYTIPRTIAAIGEERLTWLRALPLRQSLGELSIVHATADDAWPIVPPTASDVELKRGYGALGAKVVVYGHIHHAFVRRLAGLRVVNAGAVSLSFDGDPRASYAVIDSDQVSIRRVAYDVDAEIELLLKSDDPFRTSTIATLRTGRYAP
jgi:diadenosine tetraphosphatase ApaH/serine/threonine PP2A family protein phosphatase